MKEQVKILIEKQKLIKRVKELAEEISRDYEGKELHLICILKGSIMFTVDLARELTCPTLFHFMKVSSYGGSTSTSGVIKIEQDLDENIEGKDVLVVEDIVDSGRTLKNLTELLRSRHPATLKVCSLLDKPDRRQVEMAADYTGFVIPDEFVVGYGLDYDQRYRNLDFIGVLSFLEEN